MKIKQAKNTDGKWEMINSSSDFQADACQLVLVFGGKDKITENEILTLKKEYRNSIIVSTSTAGEVLGDEIFNEALTLAAIEFEKTKIETVFLNSKDYNDSFEIGAHLIKNLPKENLKYALVLSDGSLINGTELIEGLHSENKDKILITGGLAGDGDRFSSTLVGINENLENGNVVLIGFYGDAIRIGHGSLGGWSEFGPERIVAKSDKNVLYQIENKSALKLYKEYLGDYADELPSSALLFPLSLKLKDGNKVVRTILSIDQEKESMTFAGNIPEGSTIRLMKANFDKLISASASAAENAVNMFANPDLAIIISCVGRKLILNERVVEELEEAQKVLGDSTFITGFYSYGEISPLAGETKCELQNQTMTITTLTEI